MKREQMKHEKLNREQLLALIPHAGTMCLLDSVEDYDESRIVCNSMSHQRDDNPLLTNARLSSIHAIEYGAQAMAVHGGLLAQKDNKNIQQGYLVALRDIKLSCEYLDDLMNPLEVTAEKIMAQGTSLIYSFRVGSNNNVVASGRVTVIQLGEQT